MAKLKLGVDVGGTFTDVVGINEDGKVYFAKTPSTPEDQSIGVLNGIRALLEELGVAPDCVTGVAQNDSGYKYTFGTKRRCNSINNNKRI